MPSPFKFLEPYSASDKDQFFGRETEIDRLYEMTLKSRLVLVYGQSGTGKTSLVQSGLASKFDYTDWLPITIRRNNDINGAVREQLKSLADIATVDNWKEAIQEIYYEYLRPVYLIFDQFEELFLLGTKGEQKSFFEDISKLVYSELPVDVILVMREDYIANLYPYEYLLPTLFDTRLRVEALTEKRLKSVVRKMVSHAGIQLENADVNSDAIWQNIAAAPKYQLPYLQIYLDRLYQLATKDKHPARPLIFSSKIIEKAGSIDKVLTEFVDAQMILIEQQMQRDFGSELPKHFAQQVLVKFVTLEGTKKPLAPDDKALRNYPAKPLGKLLGLLEQARIFRFENGIYEVAHDTIAERLVKLRSRRETELLEIVKIVKDRRVAAGKTGSYLNRKELTIVEQFRPALLANDALTQDEWRFVQKSKRRQNWTKVFVGILIAGGLGLLINLLILQKERQDKELESAALSLEQANAYFKSYNYYDALNTYKKTISELNDVHPGQLTTQAKTAAIRGEAWERMGDIFLFQTPDFQDSLHLTKSLLAYGRAFDILREGQFFLLDSMKLRLPALAIKKQTVELALGDSVAARQSLEAATEFLARKMKWEKYAALAEKQYNIYHDYLGTIANLYMANELLKVQDSIDILSDAFRTLPPAAKSSYYDLRFQFGMAHFGQREYSLAEQHFLTFFQVLKNDSSAYADYYRALISGNLILIDVLLQDAEAALNNYQYYLDIKKRLLKDTLWQSEVQRIDPAITGNYAIALIFQNRWQEAQPLLVDLLQDEHLFQGMTWQQNLKQVLNDLYKAGVVHPDLVQLESLIAKHPVIPDIPIDSLR